ncbi:MAG: hypothetical protein KC589_01585 [Nanoarchaeota archaeon]|nr:hypothetical protein [Nanoarchaeota archaeon]
MFCLDLYIDFLVFKILAFKMRHKKRRLTHNYLRPQNYYNRLITFFLLISILLTFSLVRFTITSLDFFLFKIMVIFFLLVLIAVLVEFFYKGDYMSPLEVYDIEVFYNRICEDLNYDLGDLDKYFNSYDLKTRKNFDKIFHKRKNYILSSISKRDNIYKIVLINNQKLLQFFFIRFFLGQTMHKLYVKKIKDDFKVIGVK